MSALKITSNFGKQNIKTQFRNITSNNSEMIQVINKEWEIAKTYIFDVALRKGNFQDKKHKQYKREKKIRELQNEIDALKYGADLGIRKLQRKIDALKNGADVEDIEEY